MILDGPTEFTVLCQTDKEFDAFMDRIETLNRMTFHVATRNDFYMGHAVRECRADPVSRLCAVVFLEDLITQLDVVPPLVGVPFDFEDTVKALEDFVAENPFV